MTVTYRVGKGLYVNLTNRCSNRCSFCVRESQSAVGDAQSLWLEREPLRQEVWEELDAQDLEAFDEVVFCGYGEPTERLDDLLWLAEKLKARGVRVRVNTNGHASLIAGEDVSARFEGRVDCLSISLNCPTAREYAELCSPEFGLEAYPGLLDFAQKAARFVPEVVLSVVEGTTDVDACRAVAEGIGLPLRVRARIE